MRKFLTLIALVLIAPFAHAEYTAVDVVDFLKQLVPENKVYTEYYGTEAGSEDACKLMIDYVDAQDSGQFAIPASGSATLWVNRKGSKWPIKFHVKDQSQSLDFQYAEIDGNYLEAQNIVIPNDQYSSKERQTLKLLYNDSAIQATIINEVKGFFGYKTKYKATCSLSR